MFKAANLQVSVSDRRNRFEVLTDLVGSYYIYMNGEKRHSRLSDVLLWGNMVLIALPDQYKGTIHNEHVVPLSYLFDNCFEIINNTTLDGISDSSTIEQRRQKWNSAGVRENILNILIRNLVVVQLPKECSDRLDSKDLDLKASMPKEWAFGEDIFLRFNDLYTVDKITELRSIYNHYIEEYKL